MSSGLPAVSEVLAGRTTRAVNFTDLGERAVVFTVAKPAGTVVYVEAHKAGSGTFRIRVPGTLLVQVVPVSAVGPE